MVTKTTPETKDIRNSTFRYQVNLQQASMQFCVEMCATYQEDAKIYIFRMTFYKAINYPHGQSHNLREELLFHQLSEI